MEKSSLEERVTRIESILGQMDKRLNHLESEIRSLRSEMNDEVKSLGDKMGDPRRDPDNGPPEP
jgi:predicted  nucleic acid-binding Zn-ribbon protein